MALTVEEIETTNTEDYFATFLGKIRVRESWSQEDGSWGRLVAVAEKKGRTFTARRDTILVFATVDLIRAAQQSTEKDKAVEAPSCSEVHTESTVTLLSCDPAEKYLVASQDDGILSVFVIEPFLSPPLKLLTTISLEAPAICMAWNHAKSFVVLDLERKAFQVKTDGSVEDWITKEPLMTFDANESVAVWVKASTPSVLSIQGIKEVSLDGLKELPCGEEDELFITSVKIVETGMLLMTMTIMCECERTAMELALVTWSPLTYKVNIFLDDIGLSPPEKVSHMDPFLSQSLTVIGIPKWNAWLVACGEEAMTPLRLVTREGEKISLYNPEQSFVWPLDEEGDDNFMLGMGVDFSFPMKLASAAGLGNQRTCHAVISSSEDGLLIISAFGREAEDPIEPASGVSGLPRDRSHSISSSVTSGAGRQTETETGLQVSPSVEEGRPSGSLTKEEVNDLLSGITQEEETKEELTEQIKTEKEIRLLRRMQRRYNEDAAEHKRRFNSVCRIFKETRMTSMRVLDLSMEARAVVNTHDEDKIDPELEQKIQWLDRLRKRILSIQQITQRFVFTVKREGSAEERLEWDIEATTKELKRMRRDLKESFALSLRHKPPTQAEIEDDVEALMRDFQEEPDEENAADRMKEFFMWFPPWPLVTKPEERPAGETTRSSDKLWKCVAGQKQFSMVSLDPETVKAPPAASGIFVLEEGPSQKTLQWVSLDAAQGSSVQQETQAFVTEVDDSLLELCTEEEIGQIVQKQMDSRAPPQTSIVVLPPESEQSIDAAKFLKILRLADGLDREKVGMGPRSGLKLPPAPPVPTMKQYLKNLDQDSPSKPVKQLPSEPGAVEVPRLEAATSKSPSPQPEKEEVPGSVPPKAEQPQVATPAPQQQSSVLLQEAGFSAFGKASQVGSMGVAPQLGSLQQSGSGFSTPSMGGGFGSFASGGNAFGAFAGGQSQNAFAAMAQQQQPRPFANALPTGTFSVPSQKGDSKLFEMRK